MKRTDYIHFALKSTLFFTLKMKTTVQFLFFYPFTLFFKVLFKLKLIHHD